MKKDLTIYFDTSFYINLLRAEDELAFFAIEEFNKLKVRHVLSDVLVRELLSNSNSSGQDAILFERILRFTSPPYVTNDELNWEFLLEEGEDRETVARIFSELDGMLTLAHSFASVARRKKSREEELKLEENTKPLLQQLGFPEDFTDVGRTGKAGIAMLRGFGLDIPEEFEFDNPTKLSEQLLGLLNTNELEFAKNDQMLKSSSTILMIGLLALQLEKPRIRQGKNCQMILETRTTCPSSHNIALRLIISRLTQYRRNG